MNDTDGTESHRIFLAVISETHLEEFPGLNLGSFTKDEFQLSVK